MARPGQKDPSTTPADVTRKLKREEAGRYRTGDGRFTVEQSSGRWMLVDNEQADELGLPLVRGPYATLDEAREAIDGARTAPKPKSELAERLAKLPAQQAGRLAGARTAKSKLQAVKETGSAPATESNGAPKPEPEPEPEPVKVREYRSGDGERLRALWSEVGFRSLGDDDASLDRMAHRNPGLLLVATQGQDLIASALGAWDGRRGWIYHVATASEHRRTGIASRLVTQIEDRLQELGCLKVNVRVRDANDDGRAFWRARGYRADPSSGLGKELGTEPGSNPAAQRRARRA